MARLLCFAIFIMLGSCASLPDPYRYRLTVAVETPEGLRTGSSVIEVETHRSGPIPETLLIKRARGGGPMVDLGPRGRLFVLLSSDNEYQWAEYIVTRVAGEQFPEYYADRPRPTFPPRRIPVKVPRWLPATAANLDDPASGYPRFARFRDLRDWATIELVDPDDLASSFGKGVRLHHITVQLTDDPVTFGATGFLPPWKRLITAGELRRHRERPDPARLIGGDDFVRGITKPTDHQQSIFAGESRSFLRSLSAW